MAIECCVYFDKKNSEALIQQFLDLPEPIRPVYFCEDEGKIKHKNDKLVNTERFLEFQKSHRIGFFMQGMNCSFHLSIYDRGYSNVYADLENRALEVYVPEFFTRLLGAQPVFGYAAETEERAHRNGFYRDFTRGTLRESLKSWVGRDVTKYIPGVYWYTLVSERLLEQHRVKIADLALCATKCYTIPRTDLYLLQYFEHAADWQRYAKRLDDLCERIPGVFSRREVDAYMANKTFKNALECDDALHPWP